MEFLNLSGWIIGLVGTAWGFYSYFAAKSVRHLKGSYTTGVVSGLISKVSIRPTYNIGAYHGLPALFLTEIDLVNAGNSSINVQQIREPLKIRLLCTGRILAFSNESRGTRKNDTLQIVGEGPTQLALTWQYVDPKERIQIAVYTDSKVFDVNFDAFFDSTVRLTKNDQDPLDKLTLWLAAAALVTSLMGFGAWTMGLSWEDFGLTPAAASWSAEFIPPAVFSLLFLGFLQLTARFMFRLGKRSELRRLERAARDRGGDRAQEQ